MCVEFLRWSKSGRALRDPKPVHWRRLSQSIDELFSDSTQEIQKFQSMLLIDVIKITSIEILMLTTAVCCKNNSMPLIEMLLSFQWRNIVIIKGP
jgi:hypothetical protein